MSPYERAQRGKGTGQELAGPDSPGLNNPTGPIDGNQGAKGDTMARGRKARVLLIKPPIQSFYALTAGSRHIPTGLMYLAHSLQRTGAEVQIFDSLLWQSDTHFVPPSELSPIALKKVATNPLFRNIIHFGASWSRIRDAVQEAQPDLVGITCLFTPYSPQALWTAEVVRETCPRAKILLGGPHATVAWEHVFSHAPVDAVVLGEGERTFTRLVEDAGVAGLRELRSVDVSGYPGLIVRRPGGELAINLGRDFVSDLDELGFPALDLDYSAYKGVTSLITSRGCPFSCTFCSVHAIVGKVFRTRSIESLLEELRFYTSRGVRIFNVEDDNFTFDMDRVDGIMEAICRSGLDVEIRFPNGITALKMTRERLRLFARAGVRQLFFGLESTDAEARRRMKKAFAKIEAIEDLIHAARDEGIYAFASLIIGLPHQTTKDMAAEFAELFWRGIGASANPYYPIVGTELFREAKERGLLTEPDLEWYEAMNFPIEGRFSRADAAAAFVLGLTLAHGSFRRYHRRFLQTPHPPSPEEVLSVFEEIGVLVGAHSLDEVTLALDHCFCKEQNLGRLSVADAQDLGIVQPCALSSRILQMLLQLWTRRTYEVEVTGCRLTDPVERCTFRLRQAPGPLPEVVYLFLGQLGEALQNSTQPLLSEGYDRLAAGAAQSYARLGY